jgi:hypothetical protein
MSKLQRKSSLFTITDFDTPFEPGVPSTFLYFAAGPDAH